MEVGVTHLDFSDAGGSHLEMDGGRRGLIILLTARGMGGWLLVVYIGYIDEGLEYGRDAEVREIAGVFVQRGSRITFVVCCLGSSLRRRVLVDKGGLRGVRLFWAGGLGKAGFSTGARRGKFLMHQLLKCIVQLLLC
ncbi:hypothetical protein Tco_0077934 [Tanacetum coccineum]